MYVIAQSDNYFLGAIKRQKGIFFNPHYFLGYSDFVVYSRDRVGKGADTKRRDKHEMPSNCLGLKQPWHLNMKRKVNRCYSAYEGDSFTIYSEQ